MIKNERQYNITKSQMAKFKTAVNGFTAHDDRDARLRKIEEDALRSQLDELQDEVRQFEQLRSGSLKPIHIESFDERYAPTRSRVTRR